MNGESPNGTAFRKSVSYAFFQIPVSGLGISTARRRPRPDPFPAIRSTIVRSSASFLMNTHERKVAVQP